MSKNLAIAALAATALIGGTVPASAYPAAVAGTAVVNDAASDATNLQRRGGGASRPAAGQARAGPAGGQTRAKPTRQASTTHNVRSRSSANLSHTTQNRAQNVNRSGNVNRNTNRNVNRNINRDMNVDVDVHNDWNNDWDWDDRDYHPIAAGIAIGTTAAIVGSIVNSPPSTGCVTQIVNGISYTQCGNTWYQPQYAGTTVQYIVVNPPM